MDLLEGVWIGVGGVESLQGVVLVGYGFKEPFNRVSSHLFY